MVRGLLPGDPAGAARVELSPRARQLLVGCIDLAVSGLGVRLLDSVGDPVETDEEAFGAQMEEVGRELMDLRRQLCP